MNLGQVTPGAGYPNVIGSAMANQPSAGVPPGSLMAAFPPSQQTPSMPFGDAAAVPSAQAHHPPPMISLGASSATREPSPGRAATAQLQQAAGQPQQGQQSLQGSASRLDDLAQKLSAKRPVSNYQMPPTHSANDAHIAHNAPPADTIAGVDAASHPQQQVALTSPVQPTSADAAGRPSRAQSRQQQQQHVPQQQQEQKVAGGRRRQQIPQQQQQQAAVPPAQGADTYTPTRPRSDQRFKYEIGEHVYAMYMGGRWYRVAILERDVDPHPENPAIMAPNYLIKYLSNARGMADLTEWVLEECLLPLSDEARVRDLNKWTQQESKQASKSASSSAASGSTSSSSTSRQQASTQRGRKRPGKSSGNSASPRASKKPATAAVGGRSAAGSIPVPAVGGVGSGQAIRSGAVLNAAQGGVGRGGRRGGAAEAGQPQLQQQQQHQPLQQPKPADHVVQPAAPAASAPANADVEMKDVQGQPPADAVKTAANGGTSSEPTRPERIGAPGPAATVAGGVVSQQHPGNSHPPAAANAVPQQQNAAGQFVPNGGSVSSSTTTSGEPPTTALIANAVNSTADHGQSSLPQPPQKMLPSGAAGSETATIAGQAQPSAAHVDAS